MNNKVINEAKDLVVELSQSDEAKALMNTAGQLITSFATRKATAVVTSSPVGLCLITGTVTAAFLYSAFVKLNQENNSL